MNYPNTSCDREKRHIEELRAEAETLRKKLEAIHKWAALHGVAIPAHLLPQEPPNLGADST